MVGLVVFANNGGLGAQTRRLTKMLQPDKLLVINSANYSKNLEFNLDWYEGYTKVIAKNFPPTNEEVLEFMDGLTHILTCENPYNFMMVWWAKERGIKVYCQSNYEFCENISKPYLPVPDKFLMPSYWKIEDMEIRFGEDKVMYLPPPIDPDEFIKAREINAIPGKKFRFLHIVGTLAFKDRNGTLDLLKAVKYCKEDFELVIKTQHSLEVEYRIDDPRVFYELTENKTNSQLYEGYDCLVLPRRYGGLSLTTNEALMSAMPVIMPDISPNNQLLPASWLVPAKRSDSFMARSMVSVYSVDPEKLAERMDYFVKNCNSGTKHNAIRIALEQFSNEVLLPKYSDLFYDG